MSARALSFGGALLLLLLLGAAHPARGQSPSIPPAVSFAHEYIRVLRDSGAVGVLPLTVEKTRVLRGYAPNMDVLRNELAGTTITFDRWSAVPARGETPALTLVVFKVEGGADPLELSLYIEEVNGQHLLNTVRTRLQAPDKGATLTTSPRTSDRYALRMLAGSRQLRARV